MIYLAIDPGSTKSGYVIYDWTRREVIERGKIENGLLLDTVCSRALSLGAVPIIEKLDYSYAKVGMEVFAAIWWSGRFFQKLSGKKKPILVGRKKATNCFKLKNDADVRAFIINNFKGIKLAADEWQAFLLIMYVTKDDNLFLR